MPEETTGNAPAEEIQKEKPAKSGCLIKILSAILILIAVLAVVFFVRDSIVHSRAEGMLQEAQQRLVAIEVPNIPADENAENLYKQAFAGFVGKDTLSARLQSRLDDGDLEVGSAEVTKLLADNKTCLDLAMQASRKPKCVFTTDYSKGFAAPIPSLMRTRSVAQILVFSARRDAAAGRGKQAAERFAAVLRLSRGMGRMRILISHMIGLACEGIAVDGVREVLTDGKADEAFLAAMAEALAAHEKGRPKLVESLKIERTTGMLAAAQVTALKYPKGMEELGANRLQVRVLRWCGIPFRDAKFCEEQWTKVLESAAKPYPQAYEELCAVDKDPKAVEKLSALKFPYNMIMIQGNRGAESDAESLALVRAARAAVEVCRAKLKDGKYPDSAPASMPVDPFSGKPLLYRKTESGFVVYSVGSNQRKDDGGKNMFDNRREPDVVFAVDAAARKAFQDAERKKAAQRRAKRGKRKKR